MKRKCVRCHFQNPSNARSCHCCRSPLDESQNISSKRGFSKPTIAKRVSVCVAVLIAVMLGFYVSLVFSADKLMAEEALKVQIAIEILEQKGFSDEAFLLKHIASYRSNDNWLNASVEKENAYAATNFPFEIITIYPDFFRYSKDDVERAAILLHEAKHLEGKDERAAYEYVWKNRERLGWTEENYSRSSVWAETRKLTRELSPEMFICTTTDPRDCTEK